jgi:hypothetical protein
MVCPQRFVDGGLEVGKGFHHPVAGGIERQFGYEDDPRFFCSSLK